MPHLAAVLLPSPAGHHYYTSFYLLAFLLNQALLLWVGHRRGYPLRSWLLLTTGATLAFIVGTKLVVLTADEWLALLEHGTWPAGPARSVLGGVAAAVVVVLVLRRWLGFGWAAVDALGVPMCLAYAVQGLGCLLTGCCFGHLAPGGWGVQYAPGTLPYLVQLHQGLIGPDAAHALPVLPVPLLSSLLSLLLAGLLWRLRRRPWAAGSRALLHLALLLTGRFLLEFALDPAGEPLGGQLYTGAGLTLKQVQWALLPVLLLAWGGWAYRRRQPALVEGVPASQPLRNLLTLAGLLATTALLGPGALTAPELLVVQAGLAVVLVWEGARLLRHGAAQPRRLALPLGLASAVLLLTNQTTAPTDSSAVRHYLTLSPGGSWGQYNEEAYVSSGCGGSNQYYAHRYAVTGGEIAHNAEKINRRRSLGLGVWVGSERIQQYRPDGLPAFRESLVSFNPFADWQGITPSGRVNYRFRVGLHLGQLSNQQDEDFLSLRKAKPELLLRLGYGRGFVQADAGHGLLGVGNYTARVGFGYQQNAFHGSHLLLGVANTTHHYPATEREAAFLPFASATVQLGRSPLALEPYAATDFTNSACACAIPCRCPQAAEPSQVLLLS